MKDKQKWVVLESGGWRIVMPDIDILPHSVDEKPHHKKLAGMDCPCKPKINYLDKMIVHNSFEQKEKIAKSMNNLSSHV